MYSLNERVWRDIADGAFLRTSFGRIMFGLDTETLHAALDAMETALGEQGLPGIIPLAYLTLGPLYWEREALAVYQSGPGGFYDIPVIPDIGTAVWVAKMEWNLDEDQQRRLAEALALPPSVEWVIAVWSRVKAARAAPNAPRVVEATPEPVIAQEAPTTKAASTAKVSKDRAVTVRAGDIAAALQRRKACVVTLKFNKRRSVLTFEETVYASFSIGIPATGSLAGSPQIDAYSLAKRAATYRPDTLLELRSFTDSVEVRRGKSFLKIGRHDRDGVPLKRHAPPVNKRHDGTVEVVPEGHRIAPPKGDTWDLSAQVPFTGAANEPIKTVAAPINHLERRPRNPGIEKPRSGL